MNHEEFGKLVQSLRKERTSFDTQKNLGIWTQQELAEKSALSIFVIRKIEGGKLKNLTEDILVKLAKALELTNGERQEFFLAATGINQENFARSPITDEAKILEKLSESLAMIQVPGLIIDNYLDIIAVNEMFLQLYECRFVDLKAIAAIPPQGFNLLKLVFAPQFNEYRQVWGDYEKWRSIAYRNLLVFRKRTLQYRTTDYFKYLLEQLQNYELFARLWKDVVYETEEYFLGSNQTQITRQKDGRILTYIVTTETVLTQHGNLEFMTYVPVTLETSRAFHQIVQKVGSGIRRLNPDWAQKPGYL